MVNIDSWRANIFRRFCKSRKSAGSVVCFAFALIAGSVVAEDTVNVAVDDMVLQEALAIEDVAAPVSTIQAVDVSADLPAVVTFVGSSLDAAGSGFSRVDVGLYEPLTRRWLNFEEGVFGTAFKSTPAELSNSTSLSTDWSLAATLPDGAFRLYVRGRDGRSNIERWITQSFVVGEIDTDAPVSTISPPDVSADVPAVTTFTGNSTDAGGSGFKSVDIGLYEPLTRRWFNYEEGKFSTEFKVKPAQLSNTTSLSTDWSLTATLPDGAYRLYVRGRDGYNNIEKWIRQSFVVGELDTDAPVSTINPLDTSADIPAVTTFTGSSLDAGGSGFKSVDIGLYEPLTRRWFNSEEGVFSTVFKLKPAQLSNTTSLSTDWSLTATLPDGVYRLYVRGRDGRNNIERWIRQPFVVGELDTDAPVSTISPPDTSADIPAVTTFTGRSLDAGGSGFTSVDVGLYEPLTRRWFNSEEGVFATEFKMRPAQLSNTTSLSTDWSLTATLPDGAYRLYVRGRDGLNNIEKWVRQPFVVGEIDTDAPVSTINPLNISADVPSVTTFTGSSLDTAGSGFKSVDVGLYEPSTRRWFNYEEGVFSTEFKNRSAELSNTTSLSTDWSLTAVLPKGDYRLYVRGRDGYNNIEKWVRQNFTVDAGDNPAPVANNDMAIVTSGVAQVIDVLGNDTDAGGAIDEASVSLSIIQAPSNGSAIVQSDSTVLYTHNGTNTTDSFTYTVADNEGGVSNPATVSISVDLPLTVFHRNGQTFLTWTEVDQAVSYHVYRHNVPVSADNLGAATRLTSRWGALNSDTSVNVHGGPDAPDNFVISDLAPALSDDTGLFVYTTQPTDSAIAYYAVTRVNASNEELTTELLTHPAALNEVVALPADVLTVSVNGGKGRIYTQFMDYANWNPTFNGYAYNYAVALPANYNSDQSYPLLIEPHAFSEIYKFPESSEYDWEVIQMFPHDPGAGVGALHSWWYGYAADHNYLLDGDIPASGVIENFTEQRLMRSIDTLVAHADFNIDTKLIHAYGNSMGASGAVSLGMRYSSVLAGVYANQPMTNYASSPEFVTNFEQLWGLKSANLPIVNRGPHSASIQDYGLNRSMQTGVWDWMDHHKQLVRRKADSFAYLMVAHGKADTTIDWATQGQPFVQALTDAKAAFSAISLANQGHTWFGFVSVVDSLFGFGYDENFPWRYPIDLSFPAIHNATGSGSLNPGTASDDAYNLDIEWATPHTPFADSIVDLADRYEISIRSLDTVQAADITPRNTQLFTPVPGETCSWMTADNNDDSLIASGIAIPDADGLITVPAVALNVNAGTLLVIDCADSESATSL